MVEVIFKCHLFAPDMSVKNLQPKDHGSMVSIEKGLASI